MTIHNRKIGGHGSKLRIIVLKEIMGALQETTGRLIERLEKASINAPEWGFTGN
ncbi:hypothetical protein [Defluviimonas salinarum]|uniref:hypothetical protein n=1 Tax=Defluviimonas salinarum TaxID=2992147 RepID=UPI00222F336E|nr:hypothetical protein [Defluviimonas salinarum]